MKRPRFIKIVILFKAIKRFSLCEVMRWHYSHALTITDEGGIFEAHCARCGKRIKTNSKGFCISEFPPETPLEQFMEKLCRDGK